MPPGATRPGGPADHAHWTEAPLPSDAPPFVPRTIGGELFHLVDWSDDAVEARVLREMSDGFAVYYDREWPLTIRFCEFLLSNPGLLEGRRVLVVAAGAGPEAVVAGRLGAALWINDLSETALELLGRQLVRNGVARFGVLPGSMAEIALPDDVELVVASFAVYDAATAEAMDGLLRRAAARSLPVLVANQEIGGFFGRLLRDAPLAATEIHREGELRVLLLEG
jgi:predicted nicotinamide N-methyase